MIKHLIQFYLSIAEEQLEGYTLQLSEEAKNNLRDSIEHILEERDIQLIESPNWLTMTSKNIELFARILALEYQASDQYHPQLSTEINITFLERVKATLCPILPIC